MAKKQDKSGTPIIRRRISITSADLLIRIRECGSDARDLRDAVHEASHALDCKLRIGYWQRPTIERAMKKMSRGDAIASEVEARAVEQIICERLNEPVKPVSHWVLVTCVESLKHQEKVLTPNQMQFAIEQAMHGNYAKAKAIDILRLVRREDG